MAVGAPTLFEFSKVVDITNNQQQQQQKQQQQHDDNDDAAQNVNAVQSESKRENTKCSVLFPPRALMVMQGEARYGWRHSIAARGRDYLFMEECVDDCGGEEHEKNGCLKCCSLERDTRISFTFRRVTMEN